MFHIGFTGTRHGMTDEQRAAVAETIADKICAGGFVAHHGDCIGADAQFHVIAREHHLLGPVHIVVHPPVDETHRAWCAGDEMRPSLTHMKRNKEIVVASNAMVAAPFELVEQERGGTWATIRMARKLARPLFIVYRTGHVEITGWTAVPR